MPSAIVVGGDGFIGRHLVKRLRQLDWEVVVIDLANKKLGNLKRLQKKYGQHWHSYLHTDGLYVSLADIKSWKLDVVINVASFNPNVYHVAKQPRQALRSNVELPAHLAQLCKQADVPLIHSSSSAVYEPQTTYGLQKALAESMIDDIGPRHVDLRYFNVYGPGQRANTPYTGIITKFIRAKKANKLLTIYGDGTQSRDFIYVADVVEAIVAAYTFLDIWKKHIHHYEFDIGSGKSTSVLDIANAVGGEKYFMEEPVRGTPRKTKAYLGLTKKYLNWKSSSMTPQQYIKSVLKG